MNLLKSFAAVSSMTLVSRVLGFIRDMLIARIFGAGMATDAFFVAFRIPNLLRRLFAEGAFSSAFVPILTEYKNTRSFNETHDLINHVSALMVIILFVVTFVGVVASPYIIYISAPGFSDNPEKFLLTVELLQITFPYILFISLVSIAGGILNTFGKFYIPAFTPALLNLSFIGCALWLAPFLNPPILALAWAVFIGGILQLVFQVPFLMRIRLLPRPRFVLNDTGAWRVIKKMGPAVFGASAGQISLLISTIFASFLITGSVSWLYYADRLMELPSSLLGVALGTVLLPSLSCHHTSSDIRKFSQLLDWGLRFAVILALPAAMAIALLAIPLITTLFHHGEFSVNDVLMTRDALVAYSVGLLGLILIKVLAPGFYARQNIKTPVKIAVVTIIITQLLNFTLVGPFQHVGLALSISIGAYFNAGFLYYNLLRHKIYHPQAGWFVFFIRVLLSLTVMSAILWFFMGDATLWLDSTIKERILRLLWVVALGGASYFFSLWVFGIRLKDFSKPNID